MSELRRETHENTRDGACQGLHEKHLHDESSLHHLVFEKDEGVPPASKLHHRFSICAAANANASAASHAVPPVGSLSRGEPMRGA